MKKSAILEQIKNAPKTIEQLSLALELTDADQYKQLIKKIAKLEQKGEVIFHQDGKIGLPLSELLIGIYRSNEKGFGFVSVEGIDYEFYIPKGMQSDAINGDTVTIKVTKMANVIDNKKAEAKIIAINNRAVTHLVGEFVPYSPQMAEKFGVSGYIIISDKRMNQFVAYVTHNGLLPVEGTICSVEIIEYPNENHPKSFIGNIVKELGHKNDPGVDILGILHQFNIPIQFSDDTLEQANQIPDDISENELKGREDFRNDIVITIDGDDAKDLDDAISVKRLNNGNYELSVHIADVSHYVTENSPLDIEALDRATSVYLTDRVVPMLPQRLSNGICSLHPNVDRLTKSCIMEINAAGEVINYRIVSSVIHSKQRMTYERVNMALVEQHKQAIEQYQQFMDMLLIMRELHYALYHNRRRRGAIDFESNEAKVVVDENGAPIDIYVRERGLAERMIESFMLVANETVAAHFMAKKYPFIYRIHEQPAEEKMQRFLEFITNFGVVVKGKSATVSSKQLQKVLQQVEHQPYEMVVSTLLLRSMKQAKYDYLPLGHFGLATDTYTHFTSPIRRYPDLIVHRLIGKYAQKKPLKKDFKEIENLLEQIAHQSSLMERRAVEAERETLALKKAEFMADKIGQKFDGIISSVTRFGIFVELPNTVEGLIHVSKMKDDHYEFIEQQMLLIGQRTGKIYNIGQKITVTVSRVDVLSKEIDFEIYLSNKEKKAIKSTIYQQKSKKSRATNVKKIERIKKAKRKSIKNKSR